MKLAQRGGDEDRWTKIRMPKHSPVVHKVCVCVTDYSFNLLCFFMDFPCLIIVMVIIIMGKNIYKAHFKIQRKSKGAGKKIQFT